MSFRHICHHFLPHLETSHHLRLHSAIIYQCLPVSYYFSKCFYYLAMHSTTCYYLPPLSTDLPLIFRHFLSLYQYFSTSPTIFHKDASFPNEMYWSSSPRKNLFLDIFSYRQIWVFPDLNDISRLKNKLTYFLGFLLSIF